MPALSLDFRPDALAVLTIDQPGSRANVLTAELWAELETAVNSLAGRTDLRGLIVASGKPGIFIAGADLKQLANAPTPHEPAVRAYMERGNRILFALEALPFLTVALIDGAALGGGLEVALACDFRVCGPHPKVQLGLPETKLGLIPGWGGSQRLPRTLGLAEAAKRIATGESLDAATAARHIGFVSTIVHGENLIDETAEWFASLLATYDGYAVQFGRPVWELMTKRRLTKQAPIPEAERATFAFPPHVAPSPAVAQLERVMRDGAALPLPEAVALELDAFMGLAGGDESRRRIAEFFATRKA